MLNSVSSCSNKCVVGLWKMLDSVSSSTFKVMCGLWFVLDCLSGSTYKCMWVTSSSTSTTYVNCDSSSLTINSVGRSATNIGMSSSVRRWTYVNLECVCSYTEDLQPTTRWIIIVGTWVRLLNSIAI